MAWEVEMGASQLTSTQLSLGGGLNFCLFNSCKGPAKTTHQLMMNLSNIILKGDSLMMHCIGLKLIYLTEPPV